MLYIMFKYYQNKIYLRTEDSKKQLENLKTYLLYSQYSEIITTISKAYNLNSTTPTDTHYHYLDNKNQKDIFLLFNKNTIIDEDFILLQKSKHFNSIDIFCIDYEPTFNTLNNTTINIYNIQQIHQKLLEQNIVINSTIEIKKTPKIRLKDIFRIILNKAKSKTYFIWGLALITLSLFTIYYVYYNIVGSLLLLLAIYSRFNKKFN